MIGTHAIQSRPLLLHVLLHCGKKLSCINPSFRVVQPLQHTLDCSVRIVSGDLALLQKLGDLRITSGQPHRRLFPSPSCSGHQSARHPHTRGSNFEKPISLLLILASAIIALCDHGHQNLSTQSHHNLLTKGDGYWECNEKCGMWWLRSFNRGFGGALDMSRTIWPNCNPDRKVFHVWDPSHTQIPIM